MTAVWMLLVSDAVAQTTYSWTGNGDGTSWNQGSNWNPSGPPGAGDFAVFDNQIVTLTNIPSGVTNAARVTLQNNAEVSLGNGESIIVYGKLELFSGRYYAGNGSANNFIGDIEIDGGELHLESAEILIGHENVTDQKGNLVFIAGDFIGGSGQVTLAWGSLMYNTGTFNQQDALLRFENNQEENYTILLLNNLTVKDIEFERSGSTFIIDDMSSNATLNLDGALNFINFDAGGSPPFGSPKAPMELIGNPGINYSSSGTLQYSRSVPLVGPEWTNPLSNLILQSGTVTNDAGRTISNSLRRVEGLLSGSGSIEFSSGQDTKLIYAGSSTTAGQEWPSTNGPANVTINTNGTVSLDDGSRNIANTLNFLSPGTINLGSNTLTVEGAVLNSSLAGPGTIADATTLKLGNESGPNETQTVQGGAITLNKLVIDKSDGNSNLIFVEDGAGFNFTAGASISINNGILEFQSGDVQLLNRGNTDLTIQSGGRIKTGGQDITGFNGYSVSSGTIEYNGATGESMDGYTDIGTLIINNSSSQGVTMINSQTIPQERVHIDQGTLHTNGHLKIQDGVFLTGTGSAALNGDITAEKTVTGEGDTWKMLASPLSAPFTGASETGLFSSVWTQAEEGGSVPASANPNIYTFTENTESDDLTEFWTAEQNLNTTLEPGTGVLARLFGKDDFEDESTTWPKHLQVTGPVQSNYFTQINIPITFTPRVVDGEEIGGWNLVGNPFLSTLDWELTTSENSHLESTVYIWNPEEGQYATYNSDGSIGTSGGSRYISPFQSFFVRNQSESASEITVHLNNDPGTTQHLKRGENDKIVRLNLQTEDISDEFVLRLTPGEPGAHSRQLLPPTQRITNLYTVDDEAYTIYQAKSSNEVTVPLYVVSGAESSSILSWEISGPVIQNYEEIVLRDLKTGQMIDMLNHTEYSTIAVSNYTPTGKLIPPTGNEYERFVLELREKKIPNGNSEDPTEVTLSQNYPNPFNPSTVISYQLPENSDVRLEIFDMVGRRVATLVNQHVEAGTHEVVFDAGNIASGVYLYKLQAGSEVLTRKLTLIK